MGTLAGSRVYLAGPVERDDSAANWRASAKISLRQFGVKVWDPLCKPDWLDQTFDGRAQRGDLDLFKLHAYGKLNAPPEVIRRNVQIREVALRLALAADFIICKIGGPTVGTFEEIALARQARKPILFFGELESAWRYVQFIDHGYDAFHKQWTDLKFYLDQIDDGSALIDNVPWIFLQNRWTE